MLLFFEFGMILGLLLGTPKRLECPIFGLFGLAKTSSGIHPVSMAVVSWHFETGEGGIRQAIPARKAGHSIIHHRASGGQGDGKIHGKSATLGRKIHGKIHFSSSFFVAKNRSTSKSFFAGEDPIHSC
jgi:hypothetical protein